MTTPADDLQADDRQAALFLLRRLTVEVDTFSRGFATAHALHPTDVRALVAMLDATFAGEPLGPARLADELSLTSAATTALLDRMERAGHAARRPHPTDRRRTIVEPTDHARREGREWFGALNRDMLGALRDVDDAEVTAFLRVVEALLGVVRAHNDHAPERITGAD
jgi:DNA-binding MarR family transcriptional regulator